MIVLCVSPGRRLEPPRPNASRLGRGQGRIAEHIRQLVDEIVRANQEVLLNGPVPRLLLYGTPGAVVGPVEVDFFRRHATGLDIADVGTGTHFLPEDRPGPIAAAIRSWAGI